MSGSSLEYDLSELEKVVDWINKIAEFDRRRLLETAGEILESSTDVRLK